MKKIIMFSIILILWSSQIQALGVEISLLPVKVSLHDPATLQRGARMYMNYCSGCHSLKYMRYNQMAKALGLLTFDGEVDKDLLYNNLIFTSAKIHDPIKISMPPEDAREWFGIAPPDLSLTAREKGASWIFTYLRSFYADPSRPYGANNLLVPDVGMPNVLEPLIGQVVGVKSSGEGKGKISHLMLIKKGEMNQAQFDSALEDLVTFLVYVAEPAKLVRYQIGAGVLVFLFVFLIVAYLLKKAYWVELKK